MLPPFAWVLCNGQGEPLPGAHLARGRRLIFGRNAEAEARLTVGLADRAAIELFAALRNGIPQLRVYMGQALVFSGLWTPMSGGHSVGEQSFVNLVFKDAASVLRHRLTAASVTYTATDAGLIAKALIDTTNSAHGPTSIATNAAWVEATKARDRTYEHKNIGEALVELTEVAGGFDWSPTFLDPRDNGGATMRFNVAAALGDDRPDAIFEFGAGTIENLTGYTFTTGLPVNRARAIGAQTGTPPAPLTSEQADTASESVYGTYMQAVAATDVSEAATLADKATDALRPSPAHVTAFNPDPAKAPLPWERFWIGDTVRLNIDDGAMQEQASPRVQSIEVGFDESDNVQDVVVGIDPEGIGGYMVPVNSSRRYVQQQQDVRRRLSALER